MADAKAAAAEHEAKFNNRPPRGDDNNMFKRGETVNVSEPGKPMFTRKSRDDAGGNDTGFMSRQGMGNTVKTEE